MKQFFWRFLHFSKFERLATVILLAFGLSAGLAPWLLYRPRHPKPTLIESASPTPSPPDPTSSEGTGRSALFFFNPNTTTLDEWLALGLPERTARSILNYRNKGGQFRRVEDLQKIYTLSEDDYQRLAPYVRLGNDRPPERQEVVVEAPRGELFAFDPNTVSEADLQRLGLPERSIRGWLNYRSKGGKFRRPEDVQKLYALSEDDYERLAPYIQLTVNQTVALTPVAYGSGGGYRPNYPNRTIRTVDVNRASHDDWLQLPGIGEGWARRIERYRDNLGGFASVQQVAETQGLPDSVFQKARPYLQVAAPEIHTLNLNTATREELSRHPYVTDFQARMIVSYRERNGPFRSPDDLVKIPEAKVAWVEQMRPYAVVK